ncbi:hypothetical protein Psi01_07430 [Planobispora siamensis]|uniref:Uncharacterized protein n=1 Tax=Planobispora siamensis TaxID=936338 RepID=A0A8J3S9X2_9ACTN|nr:hypothetical protein Psi01_07430 [Planobispora siamensis]
MQEIIRAEIREYVAPMFEQIMMRMDTLATKEDLNKVDRKVEDLKIDVAVLKTDMAEVKQDVSGLKRDVSDLKTDVSGLKNDMVEVKQDVSALKTDVSGLKRDFRTMDGKLDRIIGFLGMPAS